MKKLIFDRFTYLAVFSSLFLIGCMPDSVTKFKEDTPTKTTTTSSSSGSSSSSDTSSSVTEVESFEYHFVGGTDRLVLRLTDSDQISSYTVGDTLYVSETYPTDSGKGELTIVSIDTEREEMLVDIASVGTDLWVNVNDYIDNCATGFATCATGASTGAQIANLSIYLDRSDTSASLTKLPIVDPPTGDDYVFSISPTPPLGMSFDEDTGQISMPVVPFLAPELDNQFFTVTLTNGAGDINNFVFSITTVRSNQYTLTYDFTTADRIAIEVNDANGFTAGDTIYACTSSLFSLCDTAPEYVGDATIYAVDNTSSPHRLYITLGTELEFNNNYFVHVDDGSFSSQITEEPIRLFNTSDTPTITATVSPDPTLDGITSLFTSNPGLGDGFSLNSSTGSITTTGTLDQRVTDEEGTYSILVKNQSTGATIASRNMRFIVVDPPTSLGYTFSSPQTYNIGVPLATNSPVISGLPSEENTVLYTLTGGPLPSGMEFDILSGNITGTPTAYDSGSNYTINAFHPQSGSTAFDSYTMNITTASQISNLFMRQRINDKLILDMSTVSGMNVNDNMVTQNGSSATINHIDSDEKKVYVTLAAALTGEDVFKPGDTVDIAPSFVSTKAIVTSVVHEFKTTDDLTAGDITNDIYDSNGVVSLATGETVTYSISPSLPDDMTFNTSTGTITGNSAAGQATLGKTEYNISVTNAVGDVTTYTYQMQISQDPTDLSVADLEFVHVDSVSNTRFYKGMNISISNGDPAVVIDTYETGGNIEGLVVRTSGDIEVGAGIDNKTTYFAAETTKKDRIFIYTDTIDNYTVSGDITTASGDTGTVIAIAAEAGGGATTGAGRILVEVDTGSTFELGDSIDNADPYSAQESIITSITDQNFMNLILTVTDSDNFPTGSFVSTAAGDLGLVIWNDTANEKIFVRTISGQFSTGEGLDDVRTHAANADTVVSVESPYLELTLASNAIFTAGEPITADDTGYQATGKVLNVGTSNEIIVTSYDGIFEDSDNLDDLNPYNYDSSGSTTTISDVESSHMFQLVSGFFAKIKSYTRGTVSQYTISPNLPNGLQLDSLTGDIYGTPTETKALTTYTLTARNGSNTVSHTFNLMVLGEFSLFHIKSSTSSYLLHKEGQGTSTTRCVITSDQVSDSNTATKGVNDIDCVLEAGEMDLNTNGFTFNSIVSPGLCEYVSFYPFAYNDWPITTTTGTSYNEFVFTDSGDPATICSNSVTGDGVGSVISEAQVQGSGIPNVGLAFGSTYCAAGSTGCTPGTDVASPTCFGDHSNVSATGPNCDEGSYTVNTYTCADDGNGTNDCVCTLTTVETECGGDRASCIAGPYNEVGLSPNNTFTYTDTFSGVTTDYNIDGQPSKTNNIYHANYSLDMGCFETGSSNYLFDTDTWATDLGPSSASTLGFGATNPFEGYFANKFYTFNCLDASFDVKARIRVIIRDWDRSFTPGGADDLAKLDNTTARMDDSGTCFGVNCDFRPDWDAFAGGLADYTTCSHNGTSAATGTVAMTAGDATVTGTGTAFTTELVIGQAIQIFGNDYIVLEIASDTSLTLSVPAVHTATGETLTRYMDFPFPMYR